MEIKDELVIIRKIAKEISDSAWHPLKHYKNPLARGRLKHVITGFADYTPEQKYLSEYISKLQEAGIIGWEFKECNTYSGGSSTNLIKIEEARK